MSEVLELELRAGRFAVVAAGLQHVIGLPNTPEVRGRLGTGRFDEVLCRCGDERARLRCVRVFYDPHTKVNKWRVELGEVL